MILIISQDKFEPSTEDVIDWISYFESPFKRLNGIDFYRNASINLTLPNAHIEIDGINWAVIKVVWIRRWFSHQNSEEVRINYPRKDRDKLTSQLNEFLRNEFKPIVSFFFSWLPKKKVFCGGTVEEINKLSVLLKAKELGLLIPETWITANRKYFDKIRLSDDLITKPISNGPTFEIDKETYSGYTSPIYDIPNEIGENFAPSLFQTLISKKYEIRTFFLAGKFYSMAIFSQGDPQTMTDFRRYNHKKPNRVVPYKLPVEIENKLTALADYFGLRTGSFDLIKSTDNRYIFLEVNPGGQFGMVSYPCNYFIERDIAKTLIHFNRKDQ